MLFIVAGLVLILSYFSVYQPAVLSKNISPLSGQKTRHGLFLLLNAGSFFWIWNSGATQPNEWMIVSIELLLIQVAVIDTYSKIIPNRLVLLLFVLAVVQLVIHPDFSQVGSIAFICLGILGIQFSANLLLSKNMFGWGDIKLFLVLVLVYELRFLEIALFAIVTAGLFSGVLLLLDRANKDQKIPVTPFFAITILAFSINPEWSVRLLFPAF